MAQMPPLLTSLPQTECRSWRPIWWGGGLRQLLSYPRPVNGACEAENTPWEQPGVAATGRMSWPAMATAQRC